MGALPDSLGEKAKGSSSMQSFECVQDSMICVIYAAHVLNTQVWPAVWVE